ncbi:MAG: hypothetical protein JWQ22_1401 [Devosia sp.]|nr:hypothetical protein [Devosia sp.]
MKDRVDFNITNNGVSVGANVTREYFEERVLPLITTLLTDMAPSQKRGTSSRRAAGTEPKESRVGVPKVNAVDHRPAAITAPGATRAAAISSYSQKRPKEMSGTHILA